jgi:ribonuclease P protein component
LKSLTLQKKAKHRFLRNERLKSDKQIDLLFKEGKSKSSGSLRMIYLFIDDELPLQTQVMFSVPKRNFKKAVDRNRIKRKIKESYRLNKSELLNTLKDKRKNVLLAFLYKDIETRSYLEIESSVKNLMNFLSTKV